MAKERFVLDFMPSRSGLATAGQRATINEAQLWEATDFYPALDGMLQGRPGSLQHGQTITEPGFTATNAWHELFFGLDAWTITGDTSRTGHTLGLGELSITTTPSASSPSATTWVMSRNTTDTSSSEDYALKFTARLTNPKGTAGDTSGGDMRIIITGDGGTTAHTFAITADGVYREDAGGDTLIYTPTYKLDLGGYHVYEFYYDHAADEMTFWFDGVAQTATDMTLAKDTVADLTSSTTVEFVVNHVSGGGSWSVKMLDMQYSDYLYDADDPPFVGKSLVDVGEFERKLAGGATTGYFLAATKSLLYVDVNKFGAWRPIKRVQAGHTRFVPYQNNLIIFDDDGQNNSKVYTWNGVALPTQLDDAPPLRFGSEHRTRLWAAGDRNYPLRAYFCASRQPDVWFSPAYDSDETFQETTEAGYVNIPAAAGDEIRGIYGEFKDIAVIETRDGWWYVSGSSPASFQIGNISKKVGGESAAGMVQIGNDLFGVGKQGVTSISTADQAGDLQAAMPSGAIADKWSGLPKIQDKIDRNQLEDAYFAALPSLNIALLGMRGQGQTTLDKMYAFSPLNQQWVGPWSLNPTCFTEVTYGLPEVDLLLHGHADGRVSITGLSVYDDMGTSYERKFSSAMLSGRSLNPALTTRKKRWRKLKLFILPRFNRTFTLRWKTDQNGWHSDTYSQNPADLPALSDDFRLNISRMYSQNDLSVVEINLSEEGRYLQFEVTSDYHFVLQGFQVEFLAGNDEEI